MRTLSSFRNAHAGETMLVCGCGESLLDLTARPLCVTIGVNDIGRHLHPDYLVVVNPPEQFSAGRYEHVLASRARYLFTQLALDFDPERTVRFALGAYEGVDPCDSETLHYTQNSPYVAVCLAAHMGARRIGLLGVDFTDRHFFAQTGRHALASQLAVIDTQYRRLADALRSRGIELVNVSPVSRLTALPKTALREFLPRPPALNIVSYATTPAAGVPVLLARCINARTPHRARCVWGTHTYGNGVAFDRDIEWKDSPVEARAQLEAADLVVVHNGKTDPYHAELLRGKPVITMAHNYIWNVDCGFVNRGQPGVVVGQYQATLPEFAGWSAVPNPAPLWEELFQPSAKPEPVGIAYTPSGSHERYPREHPLYWHSKGYASTTVALERLRARYSVRLRVTGERMLSHREALDAKRSAHVVIDECVTGSYHRNSLEGLAAGCVVVNGVGILPEMTALFAHMSGSDEVPFVTCDLESLERCLASLIECGSAALAERGAANRRWMERHWEFAAQWERFWIPVVDRALGRAERLVPLRPEVHGATVPPLSVVIPHGGADRLPLLGAMLANLRRCAPDAETIVVELDEAPRAAGLCTAYGCRHVFEQHSGPFHKTRAVNLGIRLAGRDAVLVIDNDLLFPADFLPRAVAELHAHSLDFLAAATSVQHLSRDDTGAVLAGRLEPAACQPVNETFTAHGAICGVILARREFLVQYGGACEEFIGWGGEDNAWFHKCSLFGRAAATRHTDQKLWHLFHDRRQNPNYESNVELLRSVRAVRSRDGWLAQCPPPPSSAAAKPSRPVALPGPRRIWPRGVSIVVCHGGRDRLPQLGATLPSFRQCAGIDQVIVVDMGASPAARDLAARWADRYVFIETREVFERARSLNTGSALAECDLVLWIDNDLLMAPEFVTRAAAEIRDRELDYLLPYSHIRYLSPADSDGVRQGVRNPDDCAPVRVWRPAREVCGAAGLVRREFLERYGGLPEEFRGWGGEDNAWWVKARLLGRADVTGRPDQPLYHLFHPDSGGYGSTEQIKTNPHYSRNIELLREMRSIRDPAVFLERFPPRRLPVEAIPGDGHPPLDERPAEVSVAVSERESDSVSERGSAAPSSGSLPVWLYWEGDCPEWIRRCQATILAHAENARLLGPAEFDRLRDTDRDIDLSRLQVAHRADFIRSFLLARYGGLWIDSDCIVMRRLESVLSLLDDSDFLAHRERSGWVSNGFIGSRNGGRIATAFYTRICEILRSNRPLGWMSLGSEPLTQILNHPPVPWRELDCELVQPVCWSHPEEFFAVREPSHHAMVIKSDAICYMLSNVAIGRYRAASPGADLLASGTFFRYLLNRSLSAPLRTERAAAVWRQIPFVMEAIEEIAPQRVLEVGPNAGRWSMLLREFGGVEYRAETAANLHDIPSASSDGRYDLLLIPPEPTTLDRALAASDYVLVEGVVASERSDAASAPRLSQMLAANPLRVSVAGDASAPHAALLYSRDDPKRLRASSALEAAFASNVEQCRRTGDESLSGPGSCLLHTAEIRHRLPILIQNLGVRILIDAPCGDFHWMSHLDLRLDRYIGVDLIPALIERNNARHAAANRVFLRLDLTSDPLPDGDLILCRDCLVQLPFQHIRRAVRNFKRSGTRWLLTTTFTNRQTNDDAGPGVWRPLNLCRDPFRFPEPCRIVNEKCAEGGGRYSDKSLALWRLADLPD
jgi:Glycosyl transferase family 2/Capsular polysaccharide synthesis protein/N-terminal domain of galactosyltransferase